MSIAFDPLSGLAQRLTEGVATPKARPAWTDLVARLGAAREVACLMASDSCRESFRQPGSFAGGVAGRMAAFHAPCPTDRAEGGR